MAEGRDGTAPQGVGGGLLDVFVARAMEAGARVRRASSLASLGEQVVELVRELGAARMVRANTALLEELDLDAALAGAGVAIEVADLRRDEASAEALRAASAAADLGISVADAGIAETGTLVFRHCPGQGRALSLLPPVHVALLRARDLVADLGVFFEDVTREDRALESALTFVTGPSRTADIEMVLTQGVHGPAHLHILTL
ncbi:MAG: LUD domain-containing protein [Deltaproteobacteria bacterium]|nr:LUD domain-containing protein [Deltaproteobacteria bacterium]MBW2420225.1 LUD domain-containing protein [Deltaproteobacteria bacterium]